MARIGIIRALAPWNHRRKREAEQLAAIRTRDGDTCARCRRPIRFDLPPGSDQGARVERAGGAALFLTHGRCHMPGRDDTDAVLERLRPSREAELFASARDSRAA